MTSSSKSADSSASLSRRSRERSERLAKADSHDLIRVQGARVNNLKDVSVEIPKRRLTVFTGVSGSGKSSLVFGTIAAESQRLINETYSAFVQGFMPTLARPEVDVLDGLTTAIIVDQERMGANARSTVGTATDANAMLRILFSRLGKPHIGSPNAYSFNVPSVKASGGDHRRARRRQDEDREGDLQPSRRHVSALRGHGLGHRLRPDGAVRRQQVAQRGRAHDPRLQHGRLVRPHLPRLRLLRPGQADPQVQQEGAARPALQGADQDQGRRDQPDLRRADPADPEVVPVQGRRRAAAAHPRLRGAGGDVPDLSRVRRHPAQQGGPVVEDQGEEHRRRLLDADQRPRRLGPRPRRAVGGAAARRAATPPRLVRGDRAGLPLARPAVGHAVRRRGAAHQDDPPPRLVAHRRHLRLRRADDRPAPARHPADERPAAAAARQGQHGARRRAQAGGDRDRRPRRRSRPRRRHGRRRGGVRGHRRGAAGQRHPHRPPSRRPGLAQEDGAEAHRRAGDPRRDDAQPAATSTSTSRSACWSW